MILGTASIGARSLSQLADWIVAGDWTGLHPLVRFEAARQQADYFEVTKDFEAMLRVAQTALHLATLVVAKDETSYVGICLRIRAALALEHLGRHDEAKTWMRNAMDIALPHGYLVPFAEVSANAVGLIDELIRQYYPGLLKRYVEMAEKITRNWLLLRAIRIRPTGGVPPRISQLDLEEIEITFAVCRGDSNAEIARALQLAEGTIKNKMRRIYEKLGVSEGHPRSELVRVLWGDS